MSSALPNRFHWDTYIQDFTAAAKLQNFTPETIYESRSGPAIAWSRSARSVNAPLIYLSSGIHGDEPAGPSALLNLMTGGDYSDDYHWIIIPTLNPSGLAVQTRENANGFDLNRDYLLLQTAETIAHTSYLLSQPTPDLFISFHEDWEADGFYLYEINLGEDQKHVTKAVLEAVSSAIPIDQSPLLDGHEPRETGWIFHDSEADLPDQWPEAIYLAKNGCPLSYTFETPSSYPLSERIEAHIQGFHTLLKTKFP